MQTSERTIEITESYLILPVRYDAPLGMMEIAVPSLPTWRFGVKLATTDPDYLTFIDLHELAGHVATVTYTSEKTSDLSVLALSDVSIPHGERYNERYRPQFHFSSLRGFINDPTGLVHYEGEYHLFYEHQPFGTDIGYDLKFWGHAVSTDCVHWQELPPALVPDEHGAVYSGCVVVDWDNSTDLQRGDKPTLVALYTADGRIAPLERPFTQCLAYSTDRGRTWEKLSENPVLGHMEALNRDPHVFRHDPTDRWVMALYLDEGRYTFLGSEDLKHWAPISDFELPGSQDCPDVFRLPVDGNASRTKWVFWAANTSYVVGEFDGTTFTPEAGSLRMQPEGSSYAARSWNVGGRIVQIAWFLTPSPGMPFTHCMTVPHELSLRTIGGEVRLCAEPVGEIKDLRTDHRRIAEVVVDTRTYPALNVRDRTAPALWGEWAIYTVDRVGDTLDIECVIEPGDAEAVSVSVRGVSVVYDAAANTISIDGGMARQAGHTATPLVERREALELRILVDRTTMEVYANGGATVIALGVIPVDDEHHLAVAVKGGRACVKSLDYWRMRSIWS